MRRWTVCRSVRIAFRTRCVLGRPVSTATGNSSSGCRNASHGVSLSASVPRHRICNGNLTVSLYRFSGSSFWRFRSAVPLPQPSPQSSFRFHGKRQFVSSVFLSFSRPPSIIRPRKRRLFPPLFQKNSRHIKNDMSAYRAKPFWIHVQRRFVFTLLFFGFTFSNLGFTVQRFESKIFKKESKTVKLCAILFLTAAKPSETVPETLPRRPCWTPSSTGAVIYQRKIKKSLSQLHCIKITVTACESTSSLIEQR